VRTGISRSGPRDEFGKWFAHYEPFLGAVSAPSSDHSYLYVLSGKKGGWQSFGVFKNQGDCVSYMATNGQNPPALLSQVSMVAPEDQSLGN